MEKIKESQLIINPDGTIYHLIKTAKLLHTPVILIKSD
jgi:hypothetical protein